MGQACCKTKTIDEEQNIELIEKELQKDSAVVI
jgi:hypothetical protein